MKLLIPEKKPGLLLGIVIFLAEKYLGRRLVLARVLAWSFRLAWASLRMELSIEGAAKRLSRRLARLIRLKVSLTTHCPFCIDMNAFGHQEDGISDREVFAMREGREGKEASFSLRERFVLQWIAAQSSSPLAFSTDLKEKLGQLYSPKTLITMAALGAKVNYWARFMQSLGVPPAGFYEVCPYLPPENEKG
jgi:AhpD family alkylhydroperoxidase